MLRKTAESQTISYVLWLATFHCLEAPFCLFLLGFFLASPIAPSLPPVMLEWATWGGGGCAPLCMVTACGMCEGLLRLERHELQGGIDQWLFTKELWFFFFCCLCHPIFGSRSEPENKQKWQSRNKNVNSPCFGLDVIKFPFPSWIQQKPVVTILNWRRNALSPASSLVSSWKWYLGEVTSKTFSMCTVEALWGWTGTGSQALLGPSMTCVALTTPSTSPWLSLMPDSIQLDQIGFLHLIFHFEAISKSVCWSVGGSVDVL